MAFDPDAFLQAPVATPPPAPTPTPAAQPAGFDPDKFISSGSSQGFDPDAFLNQPTEKDAYIAKQQQLQDQPLGTKLAQTAENVATGLPSAVAGLAKGAYKMFSPVGPTGLRMPLAAQAFEPNQTGTNARQNIMDASMLDAADTYQSLHQVPKFAGMFTGAKETPAQLGADYDQQKQYENTRSNIQNLGANPEITKQLVAQGGEGSLIGRLAAPGTATVDPALQNQIQPIVDPVNYIPMAGAEGMVSDLARTAGLKAAEAGPGLTATVAGKALQGAGAALNHVSTWKDQLNSFLKSAVTPIAGPELGEMAGHAGTEAVIGKLAGHAGGPLGEMAGFLAPKALQTAGSAATGAGKVLLEGEGNVPFFERMAQEAQKNNQPASAAIYRAMDSSGVGALLAGAAKTAKNTVKAAAFTTPYQLPFAGNDPEQLASTIDSNLGFSAAGGILHNFHPLSAGEMQAKTNVDIAAVAKQDPRVNTYMEKQSAIGTQKALTAQPGLDPVQAQAMGKAYAWQQTGVLAQLMRTNPDVQWDFHDSTQPELGAGGSQFVDKDGKSHISVNMEAQNSAASILGHELIHHVNSAGYRGDVLNMLLGDPETKTDGILRKYNPDGSFTDDPAWAKFRQGYHAAKGDAPIDDTQPNVREYYRKMAEEFYAEAAGSVLAGRTNDGELNYSRIRRSGLTDAALEKVFGSNSRLKLQPAKMGFMGGAKFDPRAWLNAHPELKDTVFNYIQNKEYLQHNKKTEFTNEFSNQTHSVEWMAKHPAVAEKLYGNDLSLNFTHGPNGEVGFAGVLSKKQADVKAQAQANEILERMKQKPNLFQKSVRADGKIEYKLKDLTEPILHSLRHLNNYHKSNLIKLNDTVNHAPGTVWRFTYQPAMKGGKYKARERGMYEGIPYDIVISQPEKGAGGANILTHLLDLSQMMKNRDEVVGLMQKAGIPVDGKYTDNEWFRQKLEAMAQAHSEGRKSTDGTGISDSERDFLNAAMGVTPKENKLPVEGINTLMDTLTQKLGNPKITSAVKSFRLDRINRMDAVDNWGNIPFQYPQAKRNARPEATANLRPGDEEDRATYEAASDFFERRDRVLEDMIDAFKASKPGDQYHWPVIAAPRLKKIWMDFGKTGIIRDEKGLDKIRDQMLDGVARLHGSTAMLGHSHEAQEDIMDGLGREPFTSEEDEKFGDYMTDKKGAWMLSDYGLPKLEKLAMKLYDAKTPEDKLYTIDKMLNVIHQRSDLAGLFVQGGSKTLTEIANQGGYVAQDNAALQLRPNMRPEQQETPEFKKWFGKSQVVNPDGTPMVVYHGSPHQFEAFEKSKIYGPFDHDPVYYFTPNDKYASNYAKDYASKSEGQTKPFYLSAQKVFDTTKRGDMLKFKRDLASEMKSWEVKAYLEDYFREGLPHWDNGDAIAFAQRHGYDAVKLHERDGIVSYGVFDPTKIKSADSNSGAFNSVSPNTLHRPEDTTEHQQRLEGKQEDWNSGEKVTNKKFPHAMNWINDPYAPGRPAVSFDEGGHKWQEHRSGYEAVDKKLQQAEKNRDLQYGEHNFRPEDHEAGKDIIDAAVKHFGLTNNVYEAGYVLPDGRMLDLSGRHEAAGYEDKKPKDGQPDYLKGQRNIDHRDIGEDVPLKANNGTDRMNEFMQKSGSMRFHHLGDSISANTVGMPSPAQLALLKREAKTATAGMQIDYDLPNGETAHGEYIEKPTPAKIMRFFKDAQESAASRIKQLKERGEGMNLRPEDSAQSNQTETPEFKKWFGASKVVDEQGKPLVVYHGTASELAFDRFKRRPGDVGMHFGNSESASDRLAYKQGSGVSPAGQRVIPVFLSIKNPIRLRDSGAWNADNMKSELLRLFPKDANRIGPEFGYGGLKTPSDIRAFLKSKGYDGIVYRNTGEVSGSGPFRKQLDAAQEALTTRFGKRKNSFDLEDQKTSEYKAYSKAMQDYADHREKSTEDSYAAFDPTQIKSSIGNKGTFDPSNPSILHRPDEDGFYSHLSNVIDDKMPGKAPATAIRSMLKGNGVKDDEIKWSGVDDYLKANPTATKSDLQRFLREEGGVKIKTIELSDKNEPEPVEVSPDDFTWEKKRAGDIQFNRTENPNERVILGSHPDEDSNFIIRKSTEDDNVSTPYVLDGDWGDPFEAESIEDAKDTAARYVEQNMQERANEHDKAGDTRYHLYQVPGGHNYREQIFSLPIPKDKPDEKSDNPWTVNTSIGEKDKAYKSPHFPEAPNYLAHMRLNDRDDAEGQPGTLIEEAQSDRHQKGRERGYEGDPIEGELPEGYKARKMTSQEAERAPEGMEYAVLDRNAVPMVYGRTADEAEDSYLRSVRGKNPEPRIPDAPYRKTWHEMLFRRALAEAISSDKKWIGWTTGEAQAERYDLSKQIDRIEYKKNKDGTYGVFPVKGDQYVAGQDSVAEDKLADLVGKDVAQKIVSGEGQKGAKGGTDPVKVLKGLDLKIGGSGMTAFYDQILPPYVTKYAKKWGVKPELTEITPHSKPYEVHQETDGEADKVVGAFDSHQEAWSEARRLGPGHVVVSNADARRNIPSTTTTKIWKLPINDAMRDSIQQHGQPLFRPESEEEAGQITSEGHTPANGKTGINTGAVGARGSGGESGGQDHDIFTGTRPSSPQQWLESFQAHLAAKGKDHERDESDLFGHAAANKSFIAPKKLKALDDSEIKGGIEHRCYVPPVKKGEQPQIYKTTRSHADDPFGMAKNEEGYMQYLSDLNAATGDELDIKILGVTLEHGTEPSIVTKMAYISGHMPGKPTMSYGEREKYLIRRLVKDYGFEYNGFNHFTHKDTGVAMYDAHQGNFIERPDGTLIPVDVHFEGNITKPMFGPKAKLSDRDVDMKIAKANLASRRKLAKAA